MNARGPCLLPAREHGEICTALAEATAANVPSMHVFLVGRCCRSLPDMHF